jgi:hypothetical protein
MSQQYIVPNIYQDISDQSQGYFAFRFSCQHCGWAIETTPQRSSVKTATNLMDLGVGLIGGFWGRAAEMGEEMYGSKWHTEQAGALQKAWAEVQPKFHYCAKCMGTVCDRCYNLTIKLCTRCAPDLKADAASYQHELNVEAQRQQIEQHYRAPTFNTAGVPSAVSDDMIVQGPQQQPRLAQPSQPALQPPQHLPASAPGAQSQSLSPAAILGMGSSGYPQAVACPTCRRMGPPGKFCQDCGTKLPLPDLFCPNCSNPVEPSTRFCPECGTRLQQAT